MSVDFVMGFIAGEGTFTMGMNIAGGNRYPRLRFQIRLHEKDEDVLMRCREEFDHIGVINNLDNRDTVEWIVRTKDDLQHLRDRIEEEAPDMWYFTEKFRNFKVWSDILDIHIGGRTTPNQAIEMCTLARDGLNVDNGTSKDKWNEYIDEVKERM